MTQLTVFRIFFSLLEMVGQGGDPAQVQDSEELWHRGRGGLFSRGENATSRTRKASQGGQERGPKQKVFDQVSEVEFLRAKKNKTKVSYSKESVFIPFS